MDVSIPPFPILQHKESDNFTSLMNTNIPQIRANWGTIINAASAAYGIDANMMIAFIGVESPDLNPNAVSGAGAIGIMQMQVDTAWDYLTKQVPQISTGYTAVVNRLLPGLIKPGGFTGFLSSWSSKLEDALYDVEFNIWTGITGLSQMYWADIKSNNGNLRLDHVIIKYNAGGTDYSGNYHKYVVVPKLEKADPETLLDAFPLVETKAYLIKMLGIDGAVIVAIRTQ